MVLGYFLVSFVCSRGYFLWVSLRSARGIVARVLLKMIKTFRFFRFFLEKKRFLCFICTKKKDQYPCTRLSRFFRDELPVYASSEPRTLFNVFRTKLTFLPDEIPICSGRKQACSARKQQRLRTKSDHSGRIPIILDNRTALIC